MDSKCVECALIEYEGTQSSSVEGQRENTKLYQFHGIKYRGQRQWYHRVRNMGIEDSIKLGQQEGAILSQIGDGMAQVHNAIPHYGSAGQTISKVFDTHIQGMITHGTRFTLFRTFGNVGKGTNVAVYAWLRELEKIVKDHGCLPETLYMQIDGGPENANAMMIALAELLVHRRLCKRIYITRLPPGHTHEV